MYIGANFKNFMINRVMYSVELYVHKNVTQIVLVLSSVWFFVYIYNVFVIFCFCIYKNLYVVVLMYIDIQKKINTCFYIHKNL